MNGAYNKHLYSIFYLIFSPYPFVLPYPTHVMYIQC